MALKLMYITNKPEVAKIAEDAGIDWIFLDMEFIGKDSRQRGLDTVQNHHTVEDVKRIRKVVTNSKILVRVNPIHETINDYPSSKVEIDAVINAGADIVMLPFFKTINEVIQFVEYVNKRAKTCLLLETAEAAILIDEILKVPGIDMIHIGLNDLHLELGMKFMFQLLSDGIVEQLCNKIKGAGIPFGFGGIARLNSGMLPGADVLKEHYRLGSSMVIISRSFCNTDFITDLEDVRKTFNEGIKSIRDLEQEAEAAATYFTKNQKEVKHAVEDIIKKLELKEKK
jgi:2-keto-3-deoxy-L-rhamnonate aldolase RhmA